MLVRPAAFAFAIVPLTSTSSLAQFVTQMPLPVIADRSVAFGRFGSALGSLLSVTAGFPSGFGVHDDGCCTGAGQPDNGGVGAAAFAGSAPGTGARVGFGLGVALGAIGPSVGTSLGLGAAV